MENIIATAVAWLGMSPQGIVAGAMGAALSLFFVNGSKLSAKYSAAVLVSGTIVSGYSFELMSERWGLSLATKSAVNLMVGFMAADLMASIKTASPTFTNWIVKKIAGFAKNKLGNNKENGS